MELFILITVLAIFAETTAMTFRKLQPGKNTKRKIYVDTSALIDGRILNVARSGFMEGELVILKTVLLELQLLADGRDSEKRSRARAGLDAAAELERVVEVDVEIVDDTGGNRKVDEQLLKYAKENRGAILTLDYNLIKVAEAEKIPTLNINDLALATRTEFLPGEKIKLKILDRGSNRGQGVGHLNDGTMVVVEAAANKIGEEVEVEFVKFFETSAGRMIFARIAGTRDSVRAKTSSRYSRKSPSRKSIPRN